MRLLLTILLAVALPAQPTPEALAQRGKQAMADGRFGEAARIYADLVQQIPDNPGLLLNLGMALHMDGDDERAIPPLEQALAIAPDIFPALLFLGAGHLRQGRPQKALAPLERAVRLEPAETQVRQMLADAYTLLGRLRDALPHRLRLTEAAPQDPDAWAALVQTYEALADDAFQQLEREAPESAWMLRLVGDLRVAQQQYPSAFFLYQEALKRDPAMRGLHAGLAEIHEQTGRSDWAEIEARREADLPDADCAQSRLECAVAAGKLEEAAKASTVSPEEHYWRAKASSMLGERAFAKLTALPDSPRKHELLAVTLAEQGRAAESAESWAKALALDPDNALYAEELAARLYFAKDFKQALPRLKALAAKHPDEAHWSFLLGDLHLQQQDVEAAIPLLAKATAQAPDLLPAHHALGRAYMQVGQPERAVPHLEAALSIDADGSLHYQLAQALIRTNRRDEAAAPLARYRELQQSQAARIEAAREMEITAPAP